jgi:hypothetical protein
MENHKHEVELEPLYTSPPAPGALDIEALCHDYAQRWLGQDFSSLNASHRTELAIEAHHWIKCWAAVTSTDDKSARPERSGDPR